MTPPATPCAETGLSVRTRLIALVVAVTFFMENLDATVIATALPTMAKAFGVTPVDMNIGITAYILAVAIFIPLSSCVADRFGARRVFAGAIIVFTLASLLCGLSQSLEMFVLARVLQGIGGAHSGAIGRRADCGRAVALNAVHLLQLDRFCGCAQGAHERSVGVVQPVVSAGHGDGCDGGCAVAASINDA